MTRGSSERGFVLLAVLTLLTLLASIILLLTRENSSSLTVGERELQVNAASFVAEAGFRHAVWKASESGTCASYTDLIDVPFGKHQYSASFSTKAGSPVAISAVGELAGGASRTLISANTAVYQAAQAMVLQPGPGDGQDTHIFMEEPDQNFGADVELRISRGSENRRSLLRFDFAAMPTGVKIISATLELKSKNINGAAYVDVHRVTSDWVEGNNVGSAGSGASWNERDSGEAWLAPGGDYAPEVSSTRFVNDASGIGHQWDITTLVDAWVNRGVNNNGLILIARSGLQTGRFNSSDDDDAELRPQLSIRYACECGKVCTAGVVAGSFCDADFEPQIRKFDFDWSPDTTELTGIDFLPEGTIIDGVTMPAGGGWIMADRGEDDFFVADSQGTTLTRFPVGQPDVRGVAFVEGGTWLDHLAFADKSVDAIYFMDLDGVIRGSIGTALIAEEPFGLTYISDTSTGLYDDHLAFVSKKNGNGEIYIVDQAGTLKKTIDIDAYAPDPQGVAQLPGADKFLVTDLNGVVSIVDFIGALRQQYTVETWGLLKTHGSTIHPETCEHVLIDTDFKTVNGLSTIDTEAGGSARLLMVVADKNNLTSQEEAKKTMVESWSFTTEVISDNANLMTYAAAIANNDIVFVGEDASSGQIGNKLVDAPIGVVFEEANQATNLGLSTSIAWGFDSSIDIDYNSHYITLPFALAPLQILDTADSLAYLSGTLSADVRVLGSTGSGPMLTTLEANATTVAAQPAAGRRVLLPWGDNNFALTNLTTDGETIFRRALEWGVQLPPRCDADFVANNIVAEFPWMPGTGDIHGIDYVPEGLVVNSVTIPAGGGWIMSDNNKDRLFVTDIAGTPLTDFPAIPPDTQGIALVDSGPWRHHLALLDKNKDRVFYLNLDGSIIWSFDIADSVENGLGLGFVGATGSATYDNMLVVSSDKNLSGGGDGTLYLFDQWGVLQKTIDVEAFAPTPQGVTHVDGADKFIVSDKSGTVSVVDFDGNLLHQYAATSLGIFEINEIAVNPLTCEHVVVQKKDFENIVTLNRDVGDGSPRYIEMQMPLITVTPNSWEPLSLEIFGVPPNAVAEVAVINADGGKELWGGVRTGGSALQRRLQLHEGNGGVDMMTLHVQTDANGFIELYSADPDKLSFVVLGYWVESGYIENWQVFKAGADNSWRDHALNAYGVPPNSVTEILMVNNAGFNERKAGVRANGSSLDRRVDLHEALDGGDEAMSILTTAGADAGATIEVNAGLDADIDFYLMGHWSTPPGTFTEAFEDLGSAAVDKVWEDVDLSGDGVPASAVVQIAAVNGEDGAGVQLGARPKGYFGAPLFDLHKALNGGDEVATMHINANADSVIQWYDEAVLEDHRFYLLGWWVLSP